MACRGHAHGTCTRHAQATCTPYTRHAHAMHTPGTRHVHAMHTPCTRHAHAMHTPCTQHMHTPGTRQAHAVHTPCTEHMHTPGARHAHAMHMLCTCYAHAMPHEDGEGGGAHHDETELQRAETEEVLEVEERLQMRGRCRGDAGVEGVQAGAGRLWERCTYAPSPQHVLGVWRSV